jgi:hypothetical protein
LSTKAQTAWNRIALLALLDCAHRANPAAMTNAIIQKHLFLIELEGRLKNIKTAYYRFFRFRYGPFSNELSWNIADFEKGNFIDSESGELLERGKYLLGYVKAEIKKDPQASTVSGLIKATVDKWKSHRDWSIVEAVYGLRVPVDGMHGKVMLVRDIPQKTDILIPERSQAAEFQPLPDDLVDDVSAELAIPTERLIPSESGFRSAVESLDAALARS